MIEAHNFNDALHNTNNRHPLLEYALKSNPKELHSGELIPSKIKQLKRTTHLETSQYDSLSKTAHFIIEPSGKAVKQVHLKLFHDKGDSHACAMIELKGSAVDGGEPPTRFSTVLKNVPPETPYQFVISYQDGTTAFAADQFSLGMVSAHWEKIGNKGDKSDYKFVPPKSVLMDLEYIADFPNQMNLPTPIDANSLRVYETHVDYTKSIPDHELPVEFRGTQGTIACLACPQVIRRLKSLGCNAVQIMPLQSGLTELENMLSGKTNVWNYNCSSMYALYSKYFKADTAHGMIRELQTAIARLHDAGIYSVIDGVFGHNSENEELGTNHSLALTGDYFHVDAKGNLVDISGCGNGINYDSPLGIDLLKQIPHVYLDMYGFDVIRIDQATVLARRSGSLMFDGNSPAITFLGQEALNRGKLVIAEPCDCKDGFQIHHGEFNATIAEQNVASRDIIQDFLAGHCLRGFEHSHLIGTENEGHDSIVRSVLSLYSREYYHDKHVGKHDMSKPLDGIFSACHDGRTSWDRTKDVYKTLKKAGALTDLYPEIKNEFEKEVKVRLHIERAMVAMVLFRAGSSLVRYNSELLASQHNDKNAYTNEAFVQQERFLTEREKKILEEVAAKSPDQKERDAAREALVLEPARNESLRAAIKSANLRNELSIFDDYGKNPNLKIELRDLEGQINTMENMGIEHALRPEASLREKKSLGRFTGLCYTSTENSLEDTIKEGLGKTKPVYVVFNGNAGDFYLPKVPEGYFWKRILDTQLEVEASFTPAECKPFEKNKENNSQAHYAMMLPGVAAFKLHKGY